MIRRYKKNRKYTISDTAMAVSLTEQADEILQASLDLGSALYNIQSNLKETLPLAPKTDFKETILKYGLEPIIFMFRHYNKKLQTFIFEE